MTAISPADILIEFEEALATYPRQRCARIFSKIVQLLIAGRGRPQELLIKAVDGIMLRLIERVDASALVQLSTELAELDVAPQATLRQLASHDDADVARPILLKSQALSTTDIEAIARSCGEAHQLAISARGMVDAAVTEALLRCAGSTVCLALIKNPSARFSDSAYAMLIEKAKQDVEIANAVALRPGALDVVMCRLASTSLAQKTAAEPTARSAPTSHGLASGSLPAPTVPRRPCSTEYAVARPEIVALNRAGKLNDSTVNRFAMRGEAANLFTALSVLSGVPIEIIEHVIADTDCEGLVMACRASRLNWQTTLAILSNRTGPRLSLQQRERARKMFEALFLSTSQWTVRWGEIAASAGAGVRGATSGGD